MALLRRELYRKVKSPEVTSADCCALVFDTDAKLLYVEREVAHVDVGDGGMTELQITTMDICDYVKQAARPLGTVSYGGYYERFSKRTSISTRW